MVIEVVGGDICGWNAELKVLEVVLVCVHIKGFFFLCVLSLSSPHCNARQGKARNKEQGPIAIATAKSKLETNAQVIMNIHPYSPVQIP